MARYLPRILGAHPFHGRVQFQALAQLDHRSLLQDPVTTARRLVLLQVLKKESSDQKVPKNDCVRGKRVPYVGELFVEEKVLGFRMPVYG